MIDLGYLLWRESFCIKILPLKGGAISEDARMQLINLRGPWSEVKAPRAIKLSVGSGSLRRVQRVVLYAALNPSVDHGLVILIDALPPGLCRKKVGKRGVWGI